MAEPRIHFLVPGDPDTPTGGFVYDRHAIEGLREAGLLAGVIRIDGPFPDGDATALQAARSALKAVPDGDTVIIDGLAFTALAPAIADDAGRLRILALVHHPLGDETGLSPEAQACWLEAEMAALAHARAIVVTSRTTRARLGALGIDTARVHAVVPGVEPALDLSFRGTRAAGPLRLLCVATLIPRKGQHLLLDALTGLDNGDWTLDLVGDARNPDYAARLRNQITALGLEDRTHLKGAVSEAELEAYWRRADIFVFPSLHEGWGIAPVEAVRWGLPVVTSDAGALPESVPEAARMMVPANDAPALRDALARLIGDARYRATLAAGARRAANTLRTWADMQADFAAVMGDAA